MKDYGMHLGKHVLPSVVLAVASLIFGIIYSFSICCSACCKRKDQDKDDDPLTESKKKPVQLTLIVFLILVTGAGVVAVIAAYDEFNSLSTGFGLVRSSLANYSVNVNDTKAAYLNAVPNPPQNDQMLLFVNSVQESSGGFDAIGGMEKSIASTTSTALYVIIGVVSLAVLLLLLAVVASFSKSCSSLSLICAMLACLALTAVWLIFSYSVAYAVITADLCPTIDETLVGSVPPQMRDFTQYYLTCNTPQGPGGSPQVQMELNARQQLTALETQLQGEKNQQPQDAAKVAQLTKAVADFRVFVAAVGTITDCSPSKAAYEGFQYRLCVAGYTSNLYLFFATVLIGAIYPFAIWMMHMGWVRFREVAPANSHKDPVNEL